MVVVRIWALAFDVGLSSLHLNRQYCLVTCSQTEEIPQDLTALVQKLKGTSCSVPIENRGLWVSSLWVSLLKEKILG